MMTLIVTSDVTVVCCAALIEMVKWYRPSSSIFVYPRCRKSQKWCMRKNCPSRNTWEVTWWICITYSPFITWWSHKARKCLNHNLMLFLGWLISPEDQLGLKSLSWYLFWDIKVLFHGSSKKIIFVLSSNKTKY